jgi:DNA-binding phage protein
MSRKGLNKALSGDGNATLATVMKVAKALGLRLGFRPAD